MKGKDGRKMMKRRYELVHTVFKGAAPRVSGSRVIWLRAWELEMVS